MDRIRAKWRSQRLRELGDPRNVSNQLPRVGRVSEVEDDLEDLVAAVDGDDRPALSSVSAKIEAFVRLVRRKTTGASSENDVKLSSAWYDVKLPEGPFQMT